LNHSKTQRVQGGTAQDCAIELGVLLPGVMPNNPSKAGNSGMAGGCHGHNTSEKLGVMWGPMQSTLSNSYLVGGLEHLFPYIGNNHPN